MYKSIASMQAGASDLRKLIKPTPGGGLTGIKPATIVITARF